MDIVTRTTDLSGLCSRCGRTELLGINLWRIQRRGEGSLGAQMQVVEHWQQ